MTQTQKRLWCLLVLPWVLLSGSGCNDDDDEVLNTPVDQAVETALNSALTTTVVPLVGFMAAVGDLLSSPLQGAAGGLACPDTGDWCSTGSVACTPTVNGLAFTFDQCEVATGDLPLTLDGNVTAVPGSTVALTLTSLFINDSPAISGTGIIDPSACDYVVNMQTSEATVAGTVTQCDSDAFPTGEALVIGFGDFLVTVTFNGSSVAPATATQAGTPVASCSINLAASPLTSTCDAL